ncbi:hypothetical protein PsorP6_017642 [Peronosclerospora sorghi]|uniref:Uncharacterized protein n=1 Tax=Peronosclerospora sorghi TaxID=230839 RepID=A0ACC0WNV2_9STRA|nr:hypothetical protein PsorP6_017642 [Peronosclerospora sorghi]
MLEALDEGRQRLLIVPYGISVTTLEDVFLRIPRDREEEAAKDLGSTPRKTAATSTNSRVDQQIRQSSIARRFLEPLESIVGKTMLPDRARSRAECAERCMHATAFPRRVGVDA